MANWKFGERLALALLTTGFKFAIHNCLGYSTCALAPGIVIDVMHELQTDSTVRQ
jgi:hypothetical protein